GVGPTPVVRRESVHVGFAATSVSPTPARRPPHTTSPNLRRRRGRGPATPPSGTVARACRGCAADAPWRPQRPLVRRRVMRGEVRSGGQEGRSGPAFAARDGAWRDRRPAPPPS